MNTIISHFAHARFALGLLVVAGTAACTGTSTPTPTAARYAPSQLGGEQGTPGGVLNVSDERPRPAASDGPAFEDFERPTRIGAAPYAPALTGAADPVPGYGEVPDENARFAAVDGLQNFAQLTFAHDGEDFDPKLSRDGKWLVFASTQHRETPDVYIKAVGSRTVTQLTSHPASDVMPVISPDGSRIAFASNRGGTWGLYVMSIKGGQAVQLSAGSAHELHPSWSPDGKHLAFSRLGQVSGRWELWVMDVARPQAAEFIGYGLFPEWCPVAETGSDMTDRILFQRGRERGDRAYSLWTVDFTPGLAENFTEVASHQGLATTNATWSPDGKWIVYSTSVPGRSAAGHQGGPSDLWVAAVDGSSRAALTGGRFANALPAWGPDNRIYFVSNRGGVENVWSMGAEKALAAAGVLRPAAASTAAPAAAEKPVASAPDTAGE